MTNNTAKRLERQLKPGKVYRRAELAKWSKSVDRDTAELVTNGKLQKLQHGLYYRPKNSAFGETSASDKALVRCFLKSDDFLLMSPNAYNALGVGTTQLYNLRVVYNHKRHGMLELDGRKFEFRRRPGFPKVVSAEFLLVELSNNFRNLEENASLLEARLRERALTLDKSKLRKFSRDFGKVQTTKLVDSILSSGN